MLARLGQNFKTGALGAHKWLLGLFHKYGQQCELFFKLKTLGLGRLYFEMEKRIEALETDLKKIKEDSEKTNKLLAEIMKKIEAESKLLRNKAEGIARMFGKTINWNKQ